MSDEPALLAAILAHPDEDTPRLMYADWLQENGQPERAEFIRIQCAPDADEAAEARAAELEEQNRGRWLVGLPQFSEARWEFRRGFPEFLQAEGSFFLERFDAFTRIPWLRFLSLFGMRNDLVRELCNRSWPTQWVELELFEHIHAADDLNYHSTPSILALASCHHVLQLRRLRLSLLIFGTVGAEALKSLRQHFGDRLVID